jgi:hypothetical protein
VPIIRLTEPECPMDRLLAIQELPTTVAHARLFGFDPIMERRYSAMRATLRRAWTTRTP